MQPRTQSILTMLLELKAVAFDLLDSNHRNPGLLSLYSFIDVCSALSNDGHKHNQEIFESYLEEYAVNSRWDRYTTYDLWAARSSLLNSFLPLAHHAKKKKKGIRPIFYFSWPEKPEEIAELLKRKGYVEFILLDIQEIKWLAVDAFNELYKKIKTHPDFESIVLENAKDILPNVYYLKLEDEIRAINSLKKETGF